MDNRASIINTVSWEELKKIASVQGYDSDVVQPRSVQKTPDYGKDELVPHLSPAELKVTDHFKIRSRQRSFSQIEINTILTYGELFSCKGVNYYVINPAFLKPMRMQHFSNMVIVTGKSDGALITCYHKAQAYSRLKKEHKKTKMEKKTKIKKFSSKHSGVSKSYEDFI